MGLVAAGQVVDEPGVDGSELEVGAGGHFGDVVEQPSQLQSEIISKLANFSPCASTELSKRLVLLGCQADISRNLGRIF